MPTTEQRFWSGVEVSHDDHCWPWRRARNGEGYGHFRADGHLKKAHRAAWELTHGPITDDLHVLHHCDNPPCCNPAHLFLGTEGDNARDRNAKGRAANKDGVNNGRAKITPDQVLEAKYLRSVERLTWRQLSERYGISPSGIRLAVNGTNWKTLA